MKSFLQLAYGIMFLSLAACSTVSQQEPVPVEDRSIEGGTGEEPVMHEEPGSDVQLNAAGRRSGPVSTGSNSPVVLAMLDEADEKYRSGNPGAAVSLLERALAQEPKNAYLWHRLAVLNLEQQDWQQAYVLANKSNSLVRENPSLKINNWRVIATARRQLGDVDGASQAEREIQRLKGGE